MGDSMIRLVLLMSILTLYLPVAWGTPCTTLPKPAMTLDEVQIAIAEDGYKITLAWPTINPTIGCCSRADFDTPSWRDIFRIRQTNGNDSTSLTAFLASVTRVPGPALTLAEQARCQAMINKILAVTYRVVRNAMRVDGARPLKVLRDPTQPLSAANPLVNLTANGAQLYVEVDRQCESTPVIQTTTAGLWLYTTNVAGARGIALCK